MQMKMNMFLILIRQRKLAHRRQRYCKPYFRCFVQDLFFFSFVMLCSFIVRSLLKIRTCVYTIMSHILATMHSVIWWLTVASRVFVSMTFRTTCFLILYTFRYDDLVGVKIVTSVRNEGCKQEDIGDCVSIRLFLV